MGGGVVIPISSLPRGFGFVTFMDQAGVDKVLAQTRHELDSKTVSFTFVKCYRLLCCVRIALLVYFMSQMQAVRWMWW